MNKHSILFLLYTSIQLNQQHYPFTNAQTNQNQTNTTKNIISLEKYTSLMDSECNIEFDNSTDDELWEKHVEFQWKRAETLEELYNATNKTNFPFLVCDGTGLKPFEKMDRLVEHGLSPSNRMLVSSSINGTLASETCFIVYTKPSWCKEVIINTFDLQIIPLSYAMKMLSGSIDRIEELLLHNTTHASTAINDFDSINTIGQFIQENGTDDSYTASSDYIDIILCPGLVLNETLSEKEWRRNILNFIQTSLQKEVLYYMQHQQTLRQKFWYELLSGSMDQCGDIYDTLKFESMTMKIDENSTLSILSIDFRLLEAALKSKYYFNTTKEDTEEILDLTKSCTQLLLLAIGIQPETCSIQTRPKIEIKNQNAQWLIQTGVENALPWYDIGLNGTGEVVAVSDTGIELNHCYFHDALPRRFGRSFTINLEHRKVVQYDDYVNRLDQTFGHGTHVAGSIAGCKSDGGGVSRGIAFGAKLAFLDIGFQDGRLATPDTFRLLNTGRPYANIHSASWGSTLPVYGVQSWLMDSYIYSYNDELLLLFAAGNDGDNNAAMTVGEPATAKNVIAVGASHSIGSDATRDMLGPAYIASFSSRGPTKDGRTKPDILAPGQWVSSSASRNDDRYECDPSDGIPPGPNDVKDGLVSFQGTSMSTPIAAGAAALIRQYLREGFYPTGERNASNSITNPSASLLKAILLNGAQYMKGVDNDLKGGGVTPVEPYDNTQNFGRVSLVDSLYIKGKSNVQTVFKDRDIILNGNTKFYEVVIDTSGGCTNPTFSATLVWTDRPALPGCLQCLVNDLDLYIHKNGDTSITYYPNGLTNKDSKNNAERIRLTNIKHNDTITMYVDATNMLTPLQKFSLVASGCMMGATANSINMKEGDVFANDDSADQRRKNILMGVFIPLGFIAVGAIGYWYYNRRRMRYGP